MLVNWADFRTPPINLWVMPKFSMALPALQHHKVQRRKRRLAHEPQQELLRILAARGGN